MSSVQGWCSFNKYFMNHNFLSSICGKHELGIFPILGKDAQIYNTNVTTELNMVELGQLWRDLWVQNDRTIYLGKWKNAAKASKKTDFFWPWKMSFQLNKIRAGISYRWINRRRDMEYKVCGIFRDRSLIPFHYNAGCMIPGDNTCREILVVYLIQ